MIVLSQTTDKLQAVLVSAVATNQLHCTASWRDITATPTYTPGRTLQYTNNTTSIDLVQSPAASTQRLVDYISIYNADTAAAIAIVTVNANGLEYAVCVQQLAPGETLTYTSDAGFFVAGVPGGETFTTNEKAKLASLQDWTYVILDSAVVNSATSAINTNLFFTPASNTRYEIEGRFFLQAAATTTGVRWGLAWPSGVSQNAALGLSPSSATAGTYRFWGNTAAANVAATGVAVINEGFYGELQALLITDGSPSGNFTVTLASEVAASEVRIMQNSFIRYRTY